MTKKFNATYGGRKITLDDEKSYKVNMSYKKEIECDICHCPHYHVAAYFEDTNETDDICYECIDDLSVTIPED